MNFFYDFQTRGLDISFRKNRLFCFDKLYPDHKRHIISLLINEKKDNIKTSYSNIVFDFIKKKTDEYFSKCTDSQIKKNLLHLSSDLNSFLFEKYKDLDIYSNGTSVAIIIISNRQLFMSKFGDFLAGIATHKAVSFFQKHYNDPHDTTKIGLKNSIDDFKIYEYKLKSNEAFFILPLSMYDDFKFYFNNKFQLIEKIQKKSMECSFPYCVVFKREILKHSTIKHFKNKIYRLYGLIIVIMLLATIIYVNRGNNKFEDQLNIVREQINLTFRNIDFLKLQENIPIDYSFLFTPATNIQLTKEWANRLDYPLTHEPYFDMLSLFLVHNNELRAYDKKEMKNIWAQNFNSFISNVEILDANLMLVSTAEGKSFCLKRDSGEKVWWTSSTFYPEGNFDTYYFNQYNLNQDFQHLIPRQITQDRRFFNSILLYPVCNSIVFLDVLTGDTLSVYNTDLKINYISKYDFIEKAFYMVQGIKLVKFKIDIY